MRAALAQEHALEAAREAQAQAQRAMAQLALESGQREQERVTQVRRLLGTHPCKSFLSREHTNHSGPRFLYRYTCAHVKF